MVALAIILAIIAIICIIGAAVAYAAITTVCEGVRDDFANNPESAATKHGANSYAEWVENTDIALIKQLCADL